MASYLRLTLCSIDHGATVNCKGMLVGLVSADGLARCRELEGEQRLGGSSWNEQLSLLGAVKADRVTRFLLIFPQGDNAGSIYHDPGGHGGVHVYLETGPFVGSIHHCWHTGVSLTSNL